VLLQQQLKPRCDHRDGTSMPAEHQVQRRWHAMCHVVYKLRTFVTDTVLQTCSNALASLLGVQRLFGDGIEQPHVQRRSVCVLPCLCLHIM
jgi:hypothetical protein